MTGGVASPLVSDQQVTAFRRDRAVCLRALLSAEEVALVRAGIDGKTAQPSARAQLASRPGDPGWFVIGLIRLKMGAVGRRRFTVPPAARRFIPGVPIDDIG